MTNVTVSFPRTVPRPSFTAVVFALVLAGDGTAQAARDIEVIVGQAVGMSVDRPPLIHVEPHLAVSPRDPKFLVGAVMVFAPPDYVPRLAGYISRDGGRTWTPSDHPKPPHDSSNPWPGLFDPWTAVAGDGTVYMSGLQLSQQGGEIYLWRSRDAGGEWDHPLRLPHGTGGSFDHPVILTVPADGATDILYVFANQGARGLTRGAFGNSLLRSADRGATFSSPVMILPNNFNNHNGNIAALSDGALVASWFEIEATGTPVIRRRRLWVSLSTDGGETFLPSHLVVEGYAAGWPVVDVDLSRNGRRDRIYIAWTGIEDSTGNTDERAFVAWSDDRGVNWVDPKAVHARSKSLSNVMLAVSPEGIVGVSWYESDGDCTRLVFAASADRGESFSDPAPVSERWCPDPAREANRVPLPGGWMVYERWPTGGDYHGLAARPGGEFYALWVDGSMGVFQLQGTRIHVIVPEE